MHGIHVPITGVKEIMWLQHYSGHGMELCHWLSTSIGKDFWTFLRQTSAHRKCHVSLSSVSNHKTMLQKHVSWQKSLRTPLILFIHLRVSHGTAPLPQDGNGKKAGGSGGGRVMPPRPCWECCETGRDGLWSPRRDWQIWGDISKALCENRQQNAPHGVHALVEQERAGTSRRRFDAVSLSPSKTRYGVLNSPASIAAGERASIKEGHTM